MIGFIKKDLAMIKSNFKILLVLFVVYTFLGLTDGMDISFILPFMCIMLMISTFSYDSFNKFDAYAATLPDGRKNNVKAKYIATLLIIFIIAIITTILSFLISYYTTKTINYSVILLNILGSIFGTLLVEIIMYPCIYKFGLEKARVGIFVAVFLLVIGIGFILKFVNIPTIEISPFLEKYAVIIVILLAALLLYASYKISLRIHLKKEL